MKRRRDVCPAKAAALFIDRARRIADSLQLGIDHSRCRRWRPACIFACIQAGTDNTEFTRRT